MSGPPHRRAAALAAAGLCVAAVAPARADPPPDGRWHGSVGASLAVTSGNGRSAAALANLDLAKPTDTDKWTVGASGSYGRSEVDGVTSTTSSKAGGFTQYDDDLTPRVFGFGKVGLDHDGTLAMSLRTSLGTGLGLHVVKSKANTFEVFSGASWVLTRYATAQTIADRTDTRFRSAGLLLGEDSFHQLTPSTTLKQRLEYDLGLTGDSNQILKFNGTLSVAMTKKLALTLGVTDTFASKVAVGQHRNDLSVFTGISLQIGH